MDPGEERQWFKLPVPLVWLYNLDELPANNALADAFGDRYLYAHNPIFRQIRDAAVDLGYRFSSENTTLWRDYQAFPLTTLHRIISEKTIPYFDTGATVKRLIDGNPRVSVSPGLLLSALKANHAFHESAHCVAHGVLQKFHAHLAAVAPGDRDRFVLEAVFAESFANAVERLASTGGRMPISDAVFYVLNSYMSPNASAKSVLETAGAGMGPMLRFFVLFFGSFEANLTGEKPTEKTYNRVARAADCPEKHLADLKAVTDAAFNLSTGFRENTNPMYFDLLGFKKEYSALTETAWLSDSAHVIFARQLGQELFRQSAGSAGQNEY